MDRFCRKVSDNKNASVAANLFEVIKGLSPCARAMRLTRYSCDDLHTYAVRQGDVSLPPYFDKSIDGLFTKNEWVATICHGIDLTKMYIILGARQANICGVKAR